MALRFPGNAVIAELKGSGHLEEALDAYASIIIEHSDRKQVTQWCREYLSVTTDKSILKHQNLRKAVFYVIFHQRLLIDSTVETVWDIATRFGPTNETAVVKYLESAPRSVPSKLGRLLLYIAEFGKHANISDDDFDRIITVLFSAPNIAEAVTTEWKQNISRFRTSESRTILELAKAFEAGSPVHTLVTLFPQLPPSKANAVLNKTGKPVEELLQVMLDNPQFVEEVLTSRSEVSNKGKKSKKFVLLDEREKQAREDAIRRHNRLNFTYEYVPLEDEDPEPEDDGPVQPELSEADKKLVQQEELLWKYWQSHKEVFDRKSRKSELRRQICNKLKWTDEQVEGWARMIGHKGRSGEADLLPSHVHEVETYAPGSGAPSAPSKKEKKPGPSNSSSKSNSRDNSKASSPAPAHKASNNKNSNSQNKTSSSEERKPPSQRTRPKKSGKKNHNPKQE